MATAAGAIIAKARRDVVSHFMRANAVTEESAVTYQPGRRIRRRQFERLIAAGVIRETGKGSYWLDAPRYDEWSNDRRKRVGVAIGVIAAIGAALGLLVA